VSYDVTYENYTNYQRSFSDLVSINKVDF